VRLVCLVPEVEEPEEYSSGKTDWLESLSYFGDVVSLGEAGYACGESSRDPGDVERWRALA
jgi:hypothetical protein